MIRNYILFILLVIGILVFGISTIAIVLTSYIIGSAIIRYLNHPQYSNDSVKIYQTLFIVGFAYLLISYEYMLYHNYDYLLAFDTIDFFLPSTKSHLRADSYSLVLSSVWKDYDFLQRNMVGYFTYLTFWGYVSEIVNANLYVSLQTSTLFISSFIGVVIYRLLIINNIEQQSSYQYAIIISLFSILFFYSTQILRDSHIALFYLCAIYITFKKYTFPNLVILLGLIILIWTFRIESGLISILYIPLYLFVSLESVKAKKYAILVFLLIFSIGFAVIIFQYYDEVLFIYKANRGAYAEGIEETGGVIAMLQSLPFPADKLLSIFYNAIQPVPAWAMMKSDPTLNRPEMYNVMTFPLIFSAFFNWLVICYLSIFLFSKQIRKWSQQNISRALKYNILTAIIFLFLQSEVIAQRRIMAFYSLFYILAFLIFSRIEEQERHRIRIGVLTTFALLQVIAVLFLTNPK